MRPFTAIDGEAIDGAYALMCSSTGESVSDLADAGLRTRACLDFLLELEPANLVCFGLGYDVNNWLRELPRDVLVTLWEKQIAYWRNYRLEWLPGRWFAVKRTDGRYAKVTEVWGFFQSSFVKALEDWGLVAPAELETMKRRRGTFTRADLERIAAYCRDECRLLVELMDRLASACADAGATPRSWIGAGSIATAMLAGAGMDRHHRYDLDLAGEEVVESAVLGSYFGGRVELLRQGLASHVPTADIRSAYPAAVVELPSLERAKLVRRRRFDPAAFGVWRVRWSIGDGIALAPFPARRKTSIYYPAAGEGFYHSCEVAAALELGYPLEVDYGYVLKGPSTAERPFSWLRDAYARRARLKRAGNPAQKALKLGLNSTYGKLAQGPGFHARPRWQSYLWAGYVTARTRARMLRAAAGSRPIMLATDGLFAGAPLRGLGRANGLGSYERGELDRLFAAQPGVYQGLRGDQEIVRSRGFFAREVDYDELRRGFELEGADHIYTYRSRRFIGLGTALHRRDFGLWRQWRDETRSLVLWPERKVIGADGELWPVPGPIESEPYVPKVSLIDGRALDQLQGMEQPLREDT